MKELGDYLKETRESNGVGLDEAATDLNISNNILKNIESGNTRAFRDMIELRETVKAYAKYLGLNPEKVVDEFNDFLFQHTSKITLQDILDAEEKENKKRTKEVISPYTIIKEKKFDFKKLRPLGIIVLIVIFILLVAWILRAVLIVDNKVDTELLGDFYKEVI